MLFLLVIVRALTLNVPSGRHMRAPPEGITATALFQAVVFCAAVFASRKATLMSAACATRGSGQELAIHTTIAHINLLDAFIHDSYISIQSMIPMFQCDSSSALRRGLKIMARVCQAPLMASAVEMPPSILPGAVQPKVRGAPLVEEILYDRMLNTHSG